MERENRPSFRKEAGNFVIAGGIIAGIIGIVVYPELILFGGASACLGFVLKDLDIKGRR